MLRFFFLGVVEFLVALMPDIFVALRTGHDIQSISALYDYLGATLVMTMPAAVALGGWPAFPWGQTGVCVWVCVCMYVCMYV